MDSIKIFLQGSLFGQLYFLGMKPLLVLGFIYALRDKLYGLTSAYGEPTIYVILSLLVLLIYYVEIVTSTAIRTYRIDGSKKARDFLWHVSLDLVGPGAETDENDHVIVGRGTSRFPTEFTIAQNDEHEGEIIVNVFSDAPFPISLIGWYIHHSKIETAMRDNGAVEA